MKTIVTATGPIAIRRKRWWRRITLLDVFVVLFTVTFALVCFYPMWFVFLASITPYSEYIQNRLMVWFPNTIDLQYYIAVFSTEVFSRALFVSVVKTVLGTFLSVLITSMMAYGVSKTHIKGMTPINFLVVFTMLFSGGLIPEYMLYHDLGMLRSFWVMVLPSVLNVFYFVIMRNYFAYAAPKELEEAAMIDGASEVRTFFQVILPTAKPMLAAVALFIAVFHWNDYYSYMMFISNQPDLQPFAWVLRRTLVDPSLMNQIRSQVASVGMPVLPPIGLRMATIIIAMLPILVVYPFLQPFFAKGMMLGALKE
jgi:ABC-type sugar transport system, permease component